MKREDIITFYRENGMGVFKLIGKAPMIREWQKTTPHDTSAYQHSGGLAANLPPEIVVIDIDVRNFPKNAKGDIIKPTPIERLFEDCGIVKPNTLKVITGSGGLHIYFKKPPEVLCRKNLDKAGESGYPGIDIKTMNAGKGGYVVIPPTIHPKTNKSYCFREGCMEIIDIPQKLLDVIKRPIEIKTVVEKRSLPTGGIDSVKSLYVDWLVGRAPVAVEGSGGDNVTFSTAAMGKDFGLDMTNTYFCMLEYWNERCSPPWDEDALMEKVSNAYDYGSNALGSRTAEVMFDNIEKKEVVSINWDFMGDSNNLKKTLYNTVNFFKLPETGLRGLLTYNEFTQSVEFSARPPWQTSFHRTAWADEDMIACKYHLSSNFGFEVQDKIINEAAMVVALEHRTHPVREYLQELTWDRVPRLNTWLHKYAKVKNNSYSREVGRKLLIGAVGRIFDPGCKFDYVAVLEGKQGIRKSTLCSVLGGEWYAEVDINPSNSDIIHLITGKWIIELSEMETSRKSDADALKAFITRQTDRMRLPYARHAVDARRQCIFIGTINPQAGIGYLKDQTGNRRFWCLELPGVVDTEGLQEVRDQLFAEATHAYRSGEVNYLDKPEVDEIARFEADKRAGGDPWASTISKVLKSNPDIEKSGIRPVDLYALAIGGKISDYSIRDTVRLQKAMKSLGWAYETVVDAETGHIDGIFKRRKNSVAL